MTTNKKDYYSPSDIKDVLDRAVHNVEENINCYCLAPNKDFTRVRKLPFSTLFDFLMQLSSKSIAITFIRLIHCLHRLLYVKEENFCIQMLCAVS